jgi:hypothetical protein
MFPRRYFPGRYFAPVYFPPAVVFVIPGGTWAEPGRGLTWAEVLRNVAFMEPSRGNQWSTPTMTVLVKRAGEVRLYSMSLANLPEISSGDTVSAVASVTATALSTGAAALTLTNEAVTGSSQGAQCQIAGGTDGVTYQIVFTVTTAGGWTLVGIGYLLIDDQ